MIKGDETLYEQKLRLTVDGEDIIMMSSLNDEADIALLLGNTFYQLCTKMGWSVDDFMDIMRFGSDASQEAFD